MNSEGQHLATFKRKIGYQFFIVWIDCPSLVMAADYA
jgi:hypothetical protein